MAPLAIAPAKTQPTGVLPNPTNAKMLTSEKSVAATKEEPMNSAPEIPAATMLQISRKAFLSSKRLKDRSSISSSSWNWSVFSTGD